MVSRTSKLILINAVKHSESYNKRQEERDMWLKRRQEMDEKGDRAEKRSRKRVGSGHGSSCKQKYYKGDIYHSFRHGGYLEPGSDQPSLSTKSKASTSNKWAAELMRYEESLGQERWGHGGYKELYPEDFQHPKELRESTEPEEELDYIDKKKLKKKCRKTPPVYLISDNESCSGANCIDSTTGMKKRRRRKRSERNDTSQDKTSQDKQTKHKSHKKAKKAKKQKHKKSKKERE